MRRRAHLATRMRVAALAHPTLNPQLFAFAERARRNHTGVGATREHGTGRAGMSPRKSLHEGIAASGVQQTAQTPGPQCPEAAWCLPHQYAEAARQGPATIESC